MFVQRWALQCVNANHIIQRSPNIHVYLSDSSALSSFWFCYFYFTFLCGHLISHYSSLFAEQTLDGVGTASDDLALKREEEKQQIKDEKKKFVNLPADGGDKIMVRFLVWRNRRRLYSESKSCTLDDSDYLGTRLWQLSNPGLQWTFSKCGCNENLRKKKTKQQRIKTETKSESFRH